MTTNPLHRDLDRVLERTQGLWDDLRGERVFITGATGLFGCWFLESLLWANEGLKLNTTATLLTRDPQAFERKAPHLATHPRVEIVRGDVRSFAFPAGTYSHVIHAATDASATLNATQPATMFDTIVEGTRRCLDFAHSAGARRFLLTSSGAVYGKQPPEVSHLSEEHSFGPDPLDTNFAYAEGKRAAEMLCAIAARNGIEPKIARCFAFVGPYMKLDAHFAIGNFIRDQLAGGPIRVAGDGTPFRSYMYASDLMVWLWTILMRGESVRAYNVGSEQAVTIRELAHTVADSLYPRVDVSIAQPVVSAAPAQRYVPATARARQELGLECEVPLGEAIRRTHSWFSTVGATGKVQEAGR